MLIFLFLTFSLEKRVKVKDIKNIVINFAGYVEVKPSREDVIYTKIEVDDELKDKIEVKREGEIFYAGFKEGKEVPSDSTEDLGDIKKRVKSNRLIIMIPSDKKLNMEMNLGVSKIKGDFSGIRIGELEINTGVSSGKIGFGDGSELEEMVLNIGVGDLDIDGLGYASPESFSLNSGIGKISMDLGKEWRRKGTIEVSSAFSSIEFKIPEGLKVNMEGEGIMNIGWKNRDVENPDVEIELEGAFNLIDFDYY